MGAFNAKQSSSSGNQENLPRRSNDALAPPNDGNVPPQQQEQQQPALENDNADANSADRTPPPARRMDILDPNNPLLMAPRADRTHRYFYVNGRFDRVVYVPQGAELDDGFVDDEEFEEVDEEHQRDINNNLVGVRRIRQHPRIVARNLFNVDAA